MTGQVLTAPSYKDKRQFSRRSKTMRFRFDMDGQVHRAVCSNVSAGGAFLKASQVPAKGSQVLLSEVFRGNRDVGLRVEGEVVWTIKKATLDNPETGYAVQFAQAWTAGDTEPLKDFANVLNPNTEHVFESTERDGQAVTLYRFPKLVTAEPGHAGNGPSTYDALPEVDLASELDRLDRQQRRRTQPPEEGEEPKQESKALSYYTRARPKKPIPEGGPVTGPHGAARATGPRPITDSRRATQPPGRADNILAGPKEVRSDASKNEAAPIDVEPDVQGDQGEEGPPGSPRRRRFGGLLGLFGFGKEEGDEGVGEDSGFDHSADGLSPAFAYDGGDPDDSGEWYVSDEDPSLVLLSWKDHETEGLVEKLSATMMGVSTRGPVPLHYERVTVVPAFPSLSASRLTLHGTVTRIKDKQGDGSQTVLIRFSKVDERGKGGIFQDYLKLFQ